MALAAHQLEAFIEISRTKNVTKAAKNLRVTQSALSHRITSLEEELGAPVFLRLKGGLELTELGEQLLSYVRAKDQMESEFLSKLMQTPKSEFSGILRVATYASIGRSVVLPALQKLLKNSPAVQLHYSVNEMRDLPRMLKTGEADFVFLDYDGSRGAMKSYYLGEEEYVLVQSKNSSVESERFLNHDEEDSITFKYFSLQSERPKKIERSYLDEIYSVIDGVANGLGRSVVPKHLVENHPDIKMAANMKSLKMPVFLHYLEPAVWPKLHLAALDCIKKEVGEFLKQGKKAPR